MKMHFHIRASEDFERFNRDVTEKTGPFSPEATVVFTSPEDGIVTVDRITDDDVYKIMQGYKADPKFMLVRF